ncbi:MAG: hypothetical protein KC433_09205 [Anaerolineales bacterium]|nr:hypothetical protein [Anaerolineales bacterium]MCB8940967.1 hypothetical protein [Ardenticatenaceae bacterium]
MTELENIERDKSKKSGWKTAVNSLGPVLVTLLTLGLVIEVSFRLFYQLIPIEVCASDPIIGTYTCQPYFEYDKPVRIGYRYIPNFKLEGLWNPANPYLANSENSTAPSDRDDSFEYRFVTDDHGFPNEPAVWQDQYDIVIAGDSFTIRTAPTTWIERLEQHAGQEILTLGAPSWSTLNEAEAIRQFGLDKSPTYVLLMFFEGNDIINTQQYLERRDSGLDWRAFDMQGVSWYRRLLTPHFAAYFWQKLFPTEPEAAPDYRYPVAASTEAGLIETVFKDIHLLPLSADYETLAASDEFTAVKSTLIALNEEVAAQGAQLVVVYIPSKEHVLWSRIWDPEDVNNVLERTVTVTLSNGDSGHLQWEPRYLSFDKFGETSQAQERLMADFTAESGIQFLNLSPIFWEQSIQQGELYHYGDPHWNQAGNDLAADAIWAFLQSVAE